MKIAVIGAGSAGILSLVHLINHFPNYSIDSLNDPSIPSVGIGESTNPFFWATMYNCLDVSQDYLLSNGELDATIKRGTFYKNWKDGEFLNPLFGDNGNGIAIHFNTFKIKDFVFKILKEKYKNTFTEIQGKVDSVSDIDDKVVVVIDGNRRVYDYVIDCRGFPKIDEEKYVRLSMPANHALIHNIECDDYPSNDWGYTLHQATQDGWMFGIPLRTRKSYGYLFNDNITSAEEAKVNFSKLIEVDVNKMQNIEYKFNSYYVKKMVSGKIIKNGNNAVFLEPMFATSLWLYDFNLRLICAYISGALKEEEVNFMANMKAKDTHDLICYYYNASTKFDTKFWQNAKTYASNVIKDSLMLKTLDSRFEYMKRNNCVLPNNFDCTPFTLETLLKMDKFFGYNKWDLKNDN
jgi:tryptophan halogenase